MEQSPNIDVKIGVVIIGRNEGERLLRCIASAQHLSAHIVYVDSGSTDASVASARRMGSLVVELDLSVPFTAARARNAGWRELVRVHSEVEYVHFVDGDCEILPSWVEQAQRYFVGHSECAVVCGRRVERFPERSIYNTLCDIEWNTPIGEALACGGDAIIRREALAAMDGYRDDFIAGEEPELCVRLRHAGWKIQRIDVDMTLHDADMTKFIQWWKRTKRCGFAYALGASVHGGPQERHWVKETLRATFWGGLLPLSIVILSFFHVGFALLFTVYPVQWLRVLRSAYFEQDVKKQWAMFSILGKFPEFMGVLEFYRKKISNQKMTLIEYK